MIPPTEPSSFDYRERLNDRLTVTHRRDAVPTTTDALLLAAFLPRVTGTACELGAGGGLISLLGATRERFQTAHLVEREPILAALAARNIKDNRLADRLRVFCADLRDFDVGERYAAVFANPPYRRAGSGRPAAHHLADVSRFERAGGIADFCLGAARLLCPEGSFSVVFPTEREDELYTALGVAGLFPEETVRVLPYPGGRSRLLLCRALKHPTDSRTHTLTLARGREDRRPTDEARELYENGVLPF